MILAKLLGKLFRVSKNGPALDRYYVMPHVKIHHIKQSDTEYHTHPWNGLSIIFGWYYEIKGDGVVRKRIGWNWISAFEPHLVITFKPVWTLFIHGKRINEDWYYGSVKKPWRGPTSG